MTEAVKPEVKEHAPSGRVHPLVRRWRRLRPHCGGMWWFREDGNRHALVDHSEMILTRGGTHVESVDDAEEGTDQFYFEMTETTQKEMPGLWMQAPANISDQ